MDVIKTGRYIALCRKNLNLSQQELADDLGISNKTISKWENGKGMPDISILPALAERLGTTTDSLLHGEHVNAKVSTSAGNPNETLVYLLNKRITHFQIVSIISCVSGLIGIALWIATRQDEGEIPAMLIGSSFEAISIAIFLIVSQMTKVEYRTYNRTSYVKENFHTKQKPFICIGAFIWSFMPILTLSYLLLGTVFSFAPILIESIILTLAFGTFIAFTQRKKIDR